jgi:endonuclease YncB( thermonuclease family)
MKHIQILIAFLLLSFTMQAQLVVQVYDGDTYKILQKGKFQIIRLANVDAPELNQYYGKLVKSAVSNLILARIVEIDPIGKDPFKRTIAKVRIDDMPLDSLIVAKGWGWHFIQYSHWPELSDYEAIAKKAKLGMWRCPKNVPPWIWRKLNAKQKRFHEMCR